MDFGIITTFLVIRALIEKINRYMERNEQTPPNNLHLRICLLDLAQGWMGHLDEHLSG